MIQVCNSLFILQINTHYITLHKSTLYTIHFIYHFDQIELKPLYLVVVEKKKNRKLTTCLIIVGDKLTY